MVCTELTFGQRFTWDRPVRPQRYGPMEDRIKLPYPLRLLLALGRAYLPLDPTHTRPDINCQSSGLE
ncbi:hypothetical protein BgiBS90_006889, partial [Biomphalaria glabrata]